MVNFPGRMLFESCRVSIGGTSIFEEYESGRNAAFIELMTQYTDLEKTNLFRGMGYYEDTAGKAESFDTELDEPCTCSCNRYFLG